jgi:general secretion pathway protein B
MSYILDALRRADAERERGTVPSLHTQQFGALPSDDEAPPRPRLLIGTIVVLVLALGGVLAWNFFGGSEPPPKPVVQAVAPTPAIATPPAVAPPPVFAPQSLASASAGRPASATTAMAPPAPRPAARPPVRREAAPATSTSSAAAPGDERIYSLAELPEAIRRELPKLAYGGGSYSGDKASRLAFLNGQVFHEGDTVAPGLVLKQVKQKGVILAYKGYRFEIGP